MTKLQRALVSHGSFRSPQWLSVLYAETEIQVLQARAEHALNSFALPRAHCGSKKPSPFSGCPQGLCSQGRGT